MSAPAGCSLPVAGAGREALAREQHRRRDPRGVVCLSCERGGFELSVEAHRFMVETLGRPLAQAASAGDPALRQAERAVAETLEHHAHVRLRAAA